MADVTERKGGTHGSSCDRPDEYRKSDASPRALTKEEMRGMYKKSIEEFKNVLDLDIPRGVFEYLKAPSIVVVGILAAYVVGRLNLSIFFLVVVAYAVVFKFQRAMQRFKQSFQSLVYDQARRQKVLNSWESVEWINYITSKLWKVLEPAVSEEVFRSINTFFYQNTPPFLKSLKLSEFTLGSVPPKVIGITFQEHTEDDVVQIDADVSFIPLETGKEVLFFLKGASDAEYNSKVTLVARLGRKEKFAGINLPISVTNIGFKAKVRMVVTIARKMFFVKNVEICMLEEPYLSFELIQLKALDLMDLPVLSNWIRSATMSSLHSQLINPQSMKFNLEALMEDKVEAVGVIALQLLGLERNDSDPCHGEIDLDGKRLYATSVREGYHFSISEFFYINVSNVDNFINFSLIFGGGIYRGCIRIGTVLDGRNFGVMRLLDADGVRATLEYAAHFYPLFCAEEKKHATDTALITMKIIQIVDLKVKNVPRSAYTTSCSVIVSPDRLETSRQEGASHIIKNTVSATASLIGGFLDTFIGFSKKKSLLPSTRNTLFLHQTGTAVNTRSPRYNDSCTFLSRSLHADMIKVCVFDKEDEGSKILGSTELPASGVYNGSREWHRLRDTQSGRIEIGFNIRYVRLNDFDPRLREYTKMLRIKFGEVSSSIGIGSYFVVFRTRRGVFRSETFSTGIAPFTGACLLPLEENDSVKMYIYKENVREENFVGEGSVLQDGQYVTVEPSVVEGTVGGSDTGGSEREEEDGARKRHVKEVAIRSKDVDAGSILIEIEEVDLKDYRGVCENKHDVKVMQIAFSNFHNMGDEFRIEFRCFGELVECSKMSVGGEMGDAITLFAGSAEIKAHFKALKLGKEVLIGECLVPKRRARERIIINEGRAFFNVDMKVQYCEFPYMLPLKRGHLRLTINSIENLRPVPPKSLRDSYCKVYVNNVQKHRTRIVRRSLNPIYGEEVLVTVDKRYDVLKVTVNDVSELETSTTAYILEAPLHFLEEGRAAHRLRLQNPSTHTLTEAYIDITFEFARGGAPAKRKKNLLGSILAF